MRIVDRGIGGLERDVAELIDARDNSGMSSLAMTQWLHSVHDVGPVLTPLAVSCLYKVVTFSKYL